MTQGRVRKEVKELVGEKQRTDETNICLTLENVKVTSHCFTSLVLSTNTLRRLDYLHFTNEDGEARSCKGTSSASYSSK